MVSESWNMAECRVSSFYTLFKTRALTSSTIAKTMTRRKPDILIICHIFRWINVYHNSKYFFGIHCKCGCTSLHASSYIQDSEQLLLLFIPIRIIDHNEHFKLDMLYNFHRTLDTFNFNNCSFAHWPGTTFRASSKSLMMSPILSIPTETCKTGQKQQFTETQGRTRIKSGVTPEASCSCSLSCWWVVVAGWITSVLASPYNNVSKRVYCPMQGQWNDYIPTLAKWLASLRLSTVLLAAVASPLTPKLNTPP